MAQQPTGYRSQIMQIRSEVMALYTNLGKQPEADFCHLPVGDAAFTEDLHTKYMQKYNQLNEEWHAITNELDHFLMDLECDTCDLSETTATTHSNSDRAYSDSTQSDDSNVVSQQHFVQSVHPINDHDQLSWTQNGRKFTLFTEDQMTDNAQRARTKYESQREAFRQFRIERRKQLKAHREQQEKPSKSDTKPISFTPISRDSGSTSTFKDYKETRGGCSFVIEF